MLFLKKVFLGLAAICLIIIGGSGTQSTNLLTQGGGIVGIAAGLVALYIFGKLVWKAMGCLPSILLLAAFCVFVLYAIGAFNGGVENVVPNLQRFIGIGNSSSAEDDHEIIQLEDEDPDVSISENFEEININNTQSDEAKQTKQPELETNQNSNGITELIKGFFAGNKSEVSDSFNPKDYPMIYGQVAVVSGDTIVLNGRYVRLYGIDAPEINQKCANSQGKKYACGIEAANWLKEWIQDYEVECNVLKQNNRGNMVAVCSLGEYDIGAALVASGWAITLPNNDVYIPYEQQAQKMRRGMWQGSFYKPWDWVKMQSVTPKLKIIKRKKKSKKTNRLWDFL